MGRPYQGKTETINQRSIRVYLPTLEDLQRWKQRPNGHTANWLLFFLTKNAISNLGWGVETLFLMSSRKLIPRSINSCTMRLILAIGLCSLFPACLTPDGDEASPCTVVRQEWAMHSALTPPIVGWRLNESADSIEVVQTPGAISWNCYHIAEGNVRYSYNTTGDPPRPLAYQLNRLEICDLTHTYTRIHDCKEVYTPTSPTAPRLLVGDTIVVCGTDGPQQNVTVQILHVDANAVSFHDRFGSVAACAAS